MVRDVKLNTGDIYYDITKNIENGKYVTENLNEVFYFNEIITDEEFRYFIEYKDRHNKKEIHISKVFTDHYIFSEAIDNNESMYKILMKIMTKEIEIELKKMPYNIFLQTGYWEVIRDEKRKQTGNKCQVCASDKWLHTHHNNYKNRGKEYKNMNDLIILCSRCHKKYHDK